MKQKQDTWKKYLRNLFIVNIIGMTLFVLPLIPAMIPGSGPLAWIGLLSLGVVSFLLTPLAVINIVVIALYFYKIRTYTLQTILLSVITIILSLAFIIKVGLPILDVTVYITYILAMATFSSAIVVVSLLLSHNKRKKLLVISGIILAISIVLNFYQWKQKNYATYVTVNQAREFINEQCDYGYTIKGVYYTNNGDYSYNLLRDSFPRGNDTGIILTYTDGYPTDMHIKDTMIETIVPLTRQAESACGKKLFRYWHDGAYE